MFRPRIIPVLLLQNEGLVKSKKFKDHQYIGDPINAVKIFNDLKADELVFLDIDATVQQRVISLQFIKEVGEEANMPFAVGGGIKFIDDIRNILKAGAEKVVIGTAAALQTGFIKQASDVFGSSTITVCIDVKKKLLGGYNVVVKNGTHQVNATPLEFAKQMEQQGAGEIIIQSVDRDGMMNGYDIDLLKTISVAVTIPVVALGGSANFSDLKNAYTQAHVTAMAAGSMFVYQGKSKGIMINYIDKKQREF